MKVSDDEADDTFSTKSKGAQLKLFLDSANPLEIAETLSRGIVRGITTNPSILAKNLNSKTPSIDEALKGVVRAVREYSDDFPLSVEVMTANPKEMLKEALQLYERLEYPSLYIKIPIGWEELKVISALAKKGISVNVTACMSLNQSILASQCGAKIVSLFYGRVRDLGYSASTVVHEIHTLFREKKVESELLVGSIRQMQDINEAFLAGADIVTIPYSFLPKLAQHPKTDEVIQQFISDIEPWKCK